MAHAVVGQDGAVDEGAVAVAESDVNTFASADGEV